jgi:hypothetical protein
MMQKPPLPTREQVAAMRRPSPPLASLDPAVWRAAWYERASVEHERGGHNFAMFFPKEVLRARDAEHLTTMVFGERPSAEHAELTQRAWAAWSEIRNNLTLARSMAEGWGVRQRAVAEQRRQQAAADAVWSAERRKKREAAQARRQAELDDARREADIQDRERLARIAVGDLVGNPRGYLEALGRSLKAQWSPACSDDELRTALRARATEVLRAPDNGPR